MLLPSALRIAESIQSVLAPWCERIEIAGSIRRKRPDCGDIDLVLLPKPGIENRRGILYRIKRNCKIETGDSITGINTIAVMPLEKANSEIRAPKSEIQLDFFFARPSYADFFETIPSNFGTILLCRTGSMQHNIALAERAKSMGLHWNPYRGLLDARNKIIASETEESIYKALNLEWRPPEARETL